MAELLSSDDCEVEDPKLCTSVESWQDCCTAPLLSMIECMRVEYPQSSDVLRPKVSPNRSANGQHCRHYSNYSLLILLIISTRTLIPTITFKLLTTYVLISLLFIPTPIKN